MDEIRFKDSISGYIEEKKEVGGEGEGEADGGEKGEEGRMMSGARGQGAEVLPGWQERRMKWDVPAERQ